MCEGEVVCVGGKLKRWVGGGCQEDSASKLDDSVERSQGPKDLSGSSALRVAGDGDLAPLDASGAVVVPVPAQRPIAAVQILQELEQAVLNRVGSIDVDKSGRVLPRDGFEAGCPLTVLQSRCA